MVRRLIPLFLLACLSCTRSGGRIPSIPEGIFDLEDTLTLGLDYYPGIERIEVCPGQEGYANNVLLTFFQGRYYCMWQHSERDEDTPDTQVLCAVSSDGRVWEHPFLLAGPTDSCFVSPGGWIQRGDSLAAILNYVRADDRKAGGYASFICTRDGLSWSASRPVLMADGSPVQGLFEQDPLQLSGGRTVGAVHFMPGLELCPVYTDDPSALCGWRKAEFPEGKGSPLEPSQYVRPDRTLVMFFRDQQSSFVKLASVSDDRGERWSATERTNIPDSRSKQCAGTLPDGRCFWVGNPTGTKSRRILVLAISADGQAFDKAFVLAGPADLPPQRTPGCYKTMGYNYPKATLIGHNLWISCSQNKEDILLIRVVIN